jgi:hypothetical protein
LWFSFMELEVGWTEEFKFFILLNEVLEAAWNPEDWRRLNLSTIWIVIAATFLIIYIAMLYCKL